LIKLLLSALCVLSVLICSAQSKCSCDKTPWLKDVVSCEPTLLTNKSKLYFQFNCDSVWLVLENVKKKKLIISSLQSDLAQYNFRIGYQLIKEFKNSLLFRYGCPANGSCDHILINKYTGKKIKAFHEFLYNIDYKNIDFVLYFSNEKLNQLTLYYPNTGKEYHIPVTASDFNAIVPEYQFYRSTLTKEKLTIFYSTGTKQQPRKKSVEIDLIKNPK